MKRLLVTTLVLFLFVGCAKNPTPGTPPPPVQTANLSRTLADSLHTASNTLITLRDNGKLSQPETETVQNFILIAARNGKSMDAILLSSDDWPTQRAKIVQLWVSSGLSTAKANLSPTAGAILDTIITSVNQILSAIGGPSI